MGFGCEPKFEEALINALTHKGWSSEILRYKSEDELIRNWADIIFSNNCSKDCLNDCPLTDGEMAQLIEQINTLRTPLAINGFINGPSVTIKRDNPDDALHFGKEVSLVIFNRREIAAGKSRYQIAQQTRFHKQNPLGHNRRSDLQLLINGMPVIHIELKQSGVPVSQAYHQIEKYTHEGIFSGLFGLVQIFVAMNPEETVYFANPGQDGVFNPNYFFHWADFNNEPVNDWKDIAERLLAIPMAHQMIGYYTVADHGDGILKVLRSYQYYAANAISNRVAKHRWEEDDQLGGFVWHTTGSGKTLTSFKSAQLIAASGDADKVVFLMDRIELGTQSALEYRGFATDSESVQETEDTNELVARLKSDRSDNTLIVTSIQKMSNINSESSFKEIDIAKMNKQRIVFIIDECHRSTFGDMLATIKATFPKAIFIGFSGTPIWEINQKNKNTSATVFGNELHRYALSDGLRDKNVLGFDPYKVLTYSDANIREQVALLKAKATTVEEALADEQKAEVYYHYVTPGIVPMGVKENEDGSKEEGIEQYVPQSQYKRKEHRNAVIDDILGRWQTLSRGNMFHAMLATSSISEALLYYQMLKARNTGLKITLLVDPSDDNNGGDNFKLDSLIEILKDYKEMFGKSFTLPTYPQFKKDVSARLAHKKPYLDIQNKPEMQLNLLIVVDQMLTGFDSKWINTLYLDKVLRLENLIQAFSRTNRLFGKQKPFGVIKYYRYPHTMENNIALAIKKYSGNNKFTLFVERLEQNLNHLNLIFTDIKQLFESAGIENFEKLPDDDSEKGQFAKMFREFNGYLEAARVQGFKWEKTKYNFTHETKPKKTSVTVAFDQNTYDVLVIRYKELASGSGGGGVEEPPFDIDTTILEIDTGQIDADYMNSRFEKYLKTLRQGNASEEERQKILNELHRSYVSLSQEEQRYAKIFLHDVESGNVQLSDDKRFSDYIVQYKTQAQSDRIHKVAEVFGLDEAGLRAIMDSIVTKENLNEFNRFVNLCDSVDTSKARAYWEQREGGRILPPKVKIKTSNFLSDFILKGGFDIDSNQEL